MLSIHIIKYYTANKSEGTFATSKMYQSFSQGWRKENTHKGYLITYEARKEVTKFISLNKMVFTVMIERRHEGGLQVGQCPISWSGWGWKWAWTLSKNSMSLRFMGFSVYILYCNKVFTNFLKWFNYMQWVWQEYRQ